MTLSPLHLLALSLGLGLIVGLERQWAEKRPAGIRTFPLISLLGTLAGLLAPTFGGWTVGAGFVALAALLVISNFTTMKSGEYDPGLTTEVAVLLMYGVGVALAVQMLAAAIALTGATTVLLHWKAPLHDLVRRIGEADLRAVLRLVLIGLVILPLLPDRSLGPYGVLNPFRIWTMVVLIVGISLGAYVVHRLLGPRAGTLLSALLGGLISSTATTVSYARLARRGGADDASSAVVVTLASTIVFGRVLFEIAVVAPATFVTLAPPIVTLMALMALVSLAMFYALRGQMGRPEDAEAPSNLGAAIVFGLLYAAVLLGIAFARENFGSGALYSVAALSGLTDMDAITLSTAQLVNAGRLAPDTGWRLIVVGALANLAFKGAVVGALGTPGLLRRVGAAFGVTMLGGLGLLAFWP